MGYYLIKEVQMATVRPLTAADCLYVAENLSDINSEELQAITDMSPVVALSAMANVGESYCVVGNNDEICGAFGIVQEKNIKDAAAIWMVTTPNIKNIALEFIRKSRGWIKEFNEKYSVIYCRVYSKNLFTRKWLGLMGFDHSADIEGVGLHGEAFVEYFRIRE